MTTELTCRKSDLVQQLLWLDNQPYSLVGREPMRAIYDLDAPAKVFMMGRQYGKSTFIASDLLMSCVVRPFFKMLYVTPRMEQTSDFSNSKLQPFIKHSPAFKELMIDEDSINNVWKKNFRNGSEITLKYSFLSADSVRGISSDHLYLDETQDIINSNISVIEETLSGSKYQLRTYAGTPKTVNNTLALRWAMSTQNEWGIKCSGCNKWNIIEMSNIGPSGLICKKCGKSIPRDGSGMWIAKKELGKHVYMTGYRIPQVLSPVAKWDRIVEKLNTYSTTRFNNEVLALPYDNNANPLTEADLRGVCGDRRSEFKRSQHTEGLHLVLAVDWGYGHESLKAKRGEAPTGFTVVSLGCLDWDGKFRLIGMKRYVGNESDPIFQVEDISRLARSLNVLAVGVDFGSGFLQNAQLKQLLGPDRIIEWQANDSLKVSAKWVPEAERMLFNRNSCMTDGFVAIKNKEIRFFCWDDFRDLSEDFLTINIEFREDGQRMFYNHVKPDDGYMSFLMCKMTIEHLLKSGR